MKQLTLLDTLRVWAMLTGLLIAGFYFGSLYHGMVPSQMLSLLITAIGGFEMFLCVQDGWLSRRNRAES